MAILLFLLISKISKPSSQLREAKKARALSTRSEKLPLRVRRCCYARCFAVVHALGILALVIMELEQPSRLTRVRPLAFDPACVVLLALVRTVVQQSLAHSSNRAVPCKAEHPPQQAEVVGINYHVGICAGRQKLLHIFQGGDANRVPCE